MNDTALTTPAPPAHEAREASALDPLDALPEPFRALALKWRPVVDRAGRLSATQWRMYAEFIADLAMAAEEQRERYAAAGKTVDRTHRGSGV
jgi:hypothetical protein